MFSCCSAGALRNGESSIFAVSSCRTRLIDSLSAFAFAFGFAFAFALGFAFESAFFLPAISPHRRRAPVAFFVAFFVAFLAAFFAGFFTAFFFAGLAGFVFFVLAGAPATGGTPITVATKPRAEILPVPYRESHEVPGGGVRLAVEITACRIWSIDSVLFRAFASASISATVPVTAGVAMLVPDIVVTPVLLLDRAAMTA